MKRFFKDGTSLVALVLMNLSSIGFAASEALTWEKVKDKDGIQVYRAHTEESKFKTFKAVTRMEVENIQSFVSVFLDESAYKQWIHMLSSAELLATENPVRYVLYIETNLPWPVSDRFTKVDMVLSQTKDYSIRFQLIEPAIAAKERKGFVLAPVTRGFYEIKTIPESKEVEIIVEIFVDPGGYIPAFFVNLITDDMSYFTTKKLKRIIKSEKYKNPSTDLVNRRPWVVAE